MSYILKLRPPRLPRPSLLLSSHSLLSTSSHLVINIPLGPHCPPLQLSSGQLARLADGCAVAKMGNTAVMSTVCRGKLATSSFLPLTVDYRQKAAAAGRIPTNFLRRELGPSEREILTSRMIDRSVRPLAAKGFVEEVGISCNLLAVGVEDPEVLAINSASMALALSSLPWQGAVGAVRVGWVDGGVVINPVRKELAVSEVNLVLVGTSEEKCTMMEGEAKCVEQGKFLECVRVGLEYCAEIARQIDMLGRREGKAKKGGGTVSSISADIVEEMRKLAEWRLRSVYTDYTLDKLSRDKSMFNIRDDIVTRTRATHPHWESSKVSEAFSKVSSEVVRGLIFDESVRVDGRALSDIRPVSCEVNLHDPLHGSALFQRGQTQVMCTVALDSLHSAMKLDPMTVITGGLKEKNFLLHYEFPSYATGEVGRGGAGANRREMGHGALAEKALKQVMPDNQQFTVRLTSEVLESNGSSSMASVCGGSLALLDAGVKISEAASGVAMGLVTRGQETRVLTDIMGMEDFLGDMDFKLAATRSGVCAIQADVKISGIDFDTIRQAVEGGLEANHKILDIMGECLASPVETKSCWPVSKNITIPAQKRGKFLGPAGLNVKRISGETGVQIQPEEEGVWSLFAPSNEAMEEAELMVEQLLEEVKAPELVFGGIYTGKILELLDRGVMVELHPAMDPVLLHNSQLDNRKVSHPSLLGLEPGQDLQVKYYGRDPATGQVRISRKVLTVGAASAVKNLQSSTKRNIQEKSEDSSGTELPSHSREKRREERKQPLSSLLTSELETTETVFNPVKYAQMLSDSKIELKKEKSKNSRSSKNSNIKNVKNIDKESEDGEEHGTNKIQPSATPNSEVEEKKSEFMEATEGRSAVIAQDENPEVSSRNHEEEPNMAPEEKFKPLVKFEGFEPETLLSRDHWPLPKLVEFLRPSLAVPTHEKAEDLPHTNPVAPQKYDGETKSRKSNRAAPSQVEQDAKTDDVRISEKDFPIWHDRYDPPLPAEVLALCKTNQCDICGVEWGESTSAQEDHYQGKKHHKRVKRLLKKEVVPVGQKFDISKKFINLQRSVSSSSRQEELDDKEADVRDISDVFSKPASASACTPWHTEPVTMFVRRSVQDYQTLLKWLEELEGKAKWDEAAICDVTYGLGKIHKNLVTNICEIEDNYKYQKYHADGVRFIDEHLRKPNQQLMRVAKSTLEKMEVEYRKAVEVLGENVSIGQRLDQNLDHVWREYHEARRQLKQIKERLWEVEAHEERLVELDDWREEQGYVPEDQCHDLQELCKKIDKQNDKIIKYTRLDLDIRWKVVDSDLKKLQFLRIQALLAWLSDQKAGGRPHWLCEDLTEYLVEAGRDYCKTEDSACQGTSWVGVERNGDNDLVLEMAYSKIRGALAMVKYGRIENKRHSRELDIYKNWLEENRDSLRDSCGGQMDKLLNRAAKKVRDVDMRMAEYVGALSTGGANVRELKDSLEASRTIKRNVMKEAVHTIVHSWNSKGDGRNLPFVIYGGEDGDSLLDK